MTASSRVRSCVLILAVLALAASVVSSCSSHDDTKASDEKVCGIIDPALVTDYVGTSDYTWNGQVDGSSSGPVCTVNRSGRPALIATVLRFRDDAEAAEQATRIRDGRASMRRNCPQPRFFDDWATGNACIRSNGSLDMRIATRTCSIQLTFDSPAAPITLQKATTIAKNIAANLSSRTAD